MALTLLFATVVAVPAPAQVPQTIDVRFAAGASSASYSGVLAGDGAVQYRLGARAGQVMSVRLSSAHAGAAFNVTAPGADAALFRGAVSGSDFTGVLPVAGTYRVDVFLVRAAARRNERAPFTIDIRIEAAAPASPAAGAEGGARVGSGFWRITGLPVGDTLNLRAEPGPQAAIQLTLAEGAVLRDLGCRAIEGGRWCRVQLTGDGDSIGWVSGRYLREADPPPAAAATAGGTPVNATGTIRCTVAGKPDVQSCRFGVVRAGPGRARIDITFPDGATRTLRFSQGLVTTGGGALVRVRRDGDGSVVSVDGSESFVIPDALIGG
ncbi:SH3 domain-containing protein [Ancylobacter terrae]|uniref:SH3 domain-containing protein n=1 Tax=Ancylobacter sp. sgz301288 TaxID=3342077 RepID=UPI00385A31F0